MQELERIEELVRIHKKKKRKITFLLGGILAIGFGLFAVVLFLNREEWLSPAAPSVPAIALETEPASFGNSPTATPDTEPLSSETEEAREIQLTVSLMGDCTLGTDESFAYDTSLNAYYAVRGADYFFENVKPILENDDLSIVNLEGCLTTSTTRNQNTFAFKGAPEFVDILKHGSIEAANLANNHSYDYGEESYNETQAVLQNADIASFGYDKTALLDIKGIRVGLVGIYELATHLDCAEQLKNNISNVKAQGADLVIVVFHWGNELETIPDYNQMSLGRLAIDSGADLVVGHHPHILQGIEKYKDKYIAYSLGNFCFGGNSNPSDKDTIIYQQTFTFKNHTLLVDDNKNIIPCKISSETGTNNYQPTPVTGEEADRILQKLADLSTQIDAQRL